MVRFEPRLGELNPQLDRKDRLIAWRHLATQTACYGVTEKPGEAFDYSDPQMALFWDLLVLRVYGATYGSADQMVLRPLLAEPLECQDRPTPMAFGPDNRPRRPALSPP